MSLTTIGTASEEAEGGQAATAGEGGGKGRPMLLWPKPLWPTNPSTAVDGCGGGGGYAGGGGGISDEWPAAARRDPLAAAGAAAPMHPKGMTGGGGIMTWLLAATVKPSAAGIEGGLSLQAAGACLSSLERVSPPAETIDSEPDACLIGSRVEAACARAPTPSRVTSKRFSSVSSCSR